MKLVKPSTFSIKLQFLLTFLLLLVMPPIGTSQSYQRLDIPLKIDNKELTNPWVGGLIAPQFNSIDLDGDQKLDLLIFDRLGDVLLPYLNVGGQNEINYQFAPEYVSDFPKIENWMKIRDYNFDGVPDIFSYPIGIGVPGIEVHTGKREDGKLSFEKLKSDLGTHDILYFRLGSTVSQIYVSSIDLPEIVDLDGDGDLDVIAFDPSGNQVSYYRNIALESNQPLDSLMFRLEESCYGKFIESGFSEEVILSDDGIRCGGSQFQQIVETRHAGSTITAFDENGDDLIDIFLGDLTYNGIIRLENGGTKDKAWFTNSEVGFPSYDESVNIEVYNAVFYLDLDNDGVKDLIVAPNEDNAVQNSNHVWFYKNMGTNESPDFNLNSKTIFLEDMLHLGTDTNPVFTDVNQDGLLDLVVGTSGYRENSALESRLYYLKNVGTDIKPEFILEDDDYLNFSAFSATSKNLAPTFGDLDGDGDQDLIVGDDQGYLYFCENIAGEGNPYQFKSPVYEYQQIKVGTHVKPQIVDINEDDLPDLVIGERNFNSTNETIGSLNYLQNTGTSTDPKFVEITSEIFGGVSTKDINFINNYSSPYFFEREGDLVLFTGSENGRIYLYDEISGEPGAQFNLVSDDLGIIREGFRTAPAIADINFDQLLDIVVGNRRGGLSIYRTDLSNQQVSTYQSPVKEIEISLSPNPASNIINIKSEASQVLNYELLDIRGKVITKGKMRSNTELGIEELIPATYFIRVYNNEVDTTKKFVKI